MISRKDSIFQMGMGLGGIGLSLALAEDQGYAISSGSTNKVSKRNHAPKAKRVVHIFLNGGPSQVDTFDPKPTLSKYHGKPLPDDIKKATERKTGTALGSPFKFKKYGQSGIEISELFKELGQHTDDLCVVRSMYTDTPSHERSFRLINTGSNVMNRPSLGSWVSYGLGSLNKNLPSYIVLNPKGAPLLGAVNWQSSFLPGNFQGTYIHTSNTDIETLIENINNDTVSKQQQNHALSLLNKLNRKHIATRPADNRLEARIKTYEMAYQMQSEAIDAFNITNESKKTLERYGSSQQAKQLLITRRLLERGVRFVHVFHGETQSWDSHDNIEINHRRLAGQCSSGIAALITDLKDRGMLDDTLILICGEFGRTPAVELANSNIGANNVLGRDHNQHGFSAVLCGGGIKGGTIYGETDPFGYSAIKDKVHVHDLHATILHCLGFDHEQLTYHYGGRDHRLTDVHGKVVKGILA